MQTHWNILTSDKTLNKYIAKQPLITYRRGKNIKTLISPSYPKQSMRQQNWLEQRCVGFHKCGCCMIKCICGSFYIGSTIRSLKERIYEHLRAIKYKDTRYATASHVNDCRAQTGNKTIAFCGIEEVNPDWRGGNHELQLRRREALWILKLQAVEHGMNSDHELHYFLGD